VSPSPTERSVKYLDHVARASLPVVGEGQKVQGLKDDHVARASLPVVSEGQKVQVDSKMTMLQRPVYRLWVKVRRCRLTRR
jgi:hypothetical protein